MSDSKKTTPDLVYDGTKLTWDGVGAWNATSGLPGYQEPKYQNLRDKGPIPEGLYRVPLTLGGSASVVSYKADRSGSIVEADLDSRSAIESLTCIKHPFEKGQVLLFQQWGSNRVRLEKVRLKHANTSHRSGFYLHDSTKGYTHGCVEVDTAFFPALRDYSQKNFATKSSLFLQVEYTGTTTYGKTLKDQEVVVQCDS
jgi:hypothetical protein